VKEFRCGDVVPGCDTVIQADSEDEVLEHVAVHAREEHGMDDVPPDVVDTIKSKIVDR
jgi:predicted small metal-binding protein